MSPQKEPWHDRFLEETRELYYQRVLPILLIGVVLIPLFSILDYVVVREYFSEFLLYRIGKIRQCHIGEFLDVIAMHGGNRMRFAQT